MDTLQERYEKNNLTSAAAEELGRSGLLIAISIIYKEEAGSLQLSASIIISCWERFDVKRFFSPQRTREIQEERRVIRKF